MLTSTTSGTTRPRVGSLPALVLLPFILCLAPATVDGPVFEDSTTITNPFVPFEPGAVSVSRGKQGGGRAVKIERHLAETRSFEFAGQLVECCILEEREFLDGQQVDASVIYLGEDVDGNVLLFGELSSRFVDGKLLDHQGSYMVGGPQPGDPPETITMEVPSMYMPASPQVGDVFNHEYAPPVEIEIHTVLATDVTVKAPVGKFTGAIKVREVDEVRGTTSVRWIVPGVGVVRERGKGQQSRLIATTLVAP